jgi:hypothetical protein
MNAYFATLNLDQPPKDLAAFEAAVEVAFADTPAGRQLAAGAAKAATDASARRAHTGTHRGLRSQTRAHAAAAIYIDPHIYLYAYIYNVFRYMCI